MSAGLVTVLIGVGAGAIALWIDVRFPRLAPREIGGVIVHTVASIAVAYVTSPAIERLVAYEDPRLVLVAVFGIAFPSVVYCLLAGLWMIKVAQQSLRGYLR